MPDYKEGKIYSIRSHMTNEVYIGSTIQSLAVRLGGHKKHYKRYKEGKYHYTTSYKILDYEDAYIELIENYPCESKAELNRREGEVIRSMDCVNKIVAGRTRAEYYTENKEKVKARNAKYKTENKEKIKESGVKYRAENKEKVKARDTKYRAENKEKVKASKAKYSAERITCECGIQSTKGGILSHRKTNKHMVNMIRNFILS